ncbi:MAG: hypothetical protein ACOCXX_05160 [Planctomycetota bacterium]
MNRLTWTSLVLLLCAAAEAQAPRVVKRTRLARVDFDALHPESLRISPDCRRVAFAVFTGRGMSMVTDRAEPEEYDKLSPVVFSPDSSHYAYVAETRGRQVVVVDGTPTPPCDAVMDGSLKWSPTGARLAWAAKVKDKWHVVDRGKPGVACDEVLAGCPVFGPTGKRLVYGARTGKAWTVVLDGTPLKPTFEGIGANSFAFSHDGKRLAWWATRGGRAVVMVDGRRLGEPVDAVVMPPRFGPLGRHVAVGVDSGGTRRVVLDGTAQPAFDNLVAGSLVFSFDGSRLAYVAARGGKYVLVVDGKAGRGHEKIGSAPVFSPDGKRVAYLAVDGGAETVIENGKAGSRYEAVIAGSLRYNPAGKLEYLAGDGDKWFAVVDGTPQGRFDAIGQSGFVGPRDRRIFVAANNGKQHVVTDGAVSSGYEMILTGSVSVAPLGGPVAWVIRREGQFHVVVGGDMNEGWDRVFSTIRWSTPNTFNYIAARGRSLYLVEEQKIKGLKE